MFSNYPSDSKIQEWCERLVSRKPSNQPYNTYNNGIFRIEIHYGKPSIWYNGSAVYSGNPDRYQYYKGNMSSLKNWVKDLKNLVSS